MSTQQATVTATYGRHFEVETQEGKIFLATRRGKRHDITCNDQVLITVISEEEAVIEEKLPARNLFYRSDNLRQKSLAANIDQVIVVVANQPTFSDVLLARILVAAESNDCDTLIVHNKIDLPISERDQQLLDYYTNLQYKIIALSAKHTGVTPLLHHLKGKTSLLIGQSGMGKSTLINQMIPNHPAKTMEISTALDSGKHTTTFTRRYSLGEQTYLIDSPGLQEFGLHHVSTQAMENLFREFSPLIGQCRFHNCRHLNEPGCAFKQFAENHPMRQRRLDLLIELQQAQAH